MIQLIDFGRSINPAFVVDTPSLSPRIQKIIRWCLPCLNAFGPTRTFLSSFLLVVHIKDLGQECIDLAFSRKDWDEVRPQMQTTAIAVCHLAVSLRFPYLYLVGTESYDFISRFWELDPAKGALQFMKSTGGIWLQFLYLVSILGESPEWKYVLEQIPLGQGKTGLPEEEVFLQNASSFFSTQSLLKWVGILPLFFRSRNMQEDKFATLGRLVQIYYQCAKAQNVNLKLVQWRYLLACAGKDLLGQLVSLPDTARPILAIVGGLLAIILEYPELFKALTATNYHVGATGDPIKMDDIVGCDGAKESILKALDQIKNPIKYRTLGLTKSIKGMLFFGPPGTGKTMLAKAFATSLDNAQFLEQPGSSFARVYVGQGAKNVGNLFEKASRLATRDPNRLVVVFIDEINAVGGQRSAAPEGGEKELNSTTEAFLVAMDKIPPNVIVIGATNTHPKDLDGAFVRAGRFNKHIEFNLPTEKERVAILSKLGSACTVDAEVGELFWKKIAKQTEGWCYAEFGNLIEQACLDAGYKNLSCITRKIFQKTLVELKKQKNQSSSSALTQMYV